MEVAEAKKNLLSPEEQLRLLAGEEGKKHPAFSEKLSACGLFPLRPTAIDIFQVNIGKQCNQTCKHCHVDAGPHRKEMMSRETMELCLEALKNNPVKVVDITGGAPEMHKDFRWFVEEVRALGCHVMVRCNLTIILANKKYHDLPEFFKAHKVEVISSLPFFTAERTDRQRGEGVFEKSIRALKMLNGVGYGMEGTGLTLNLVYNPAGAFLPAAQQSLEAQFKSSLLREHNIHFNKLLTITNMPVSRFLEFLVNSSNYEGYMDKLVQWFNPKAAEGVMCRNTISVGWDGSLYDCDFNQMLELKVSTNAPQHIKEFNLAALNTRDIVIHQHCYGCTAGSGSGCGGATVK